LNPVEEISKEMIKDKMALDVKTMPKEKMQACLLDILENHYKDLPYEDLIAVNKALLITRGVRFIL
jgi:hypothetical protein